MDVLKISSKSNPSSIAGAIVGTMRSENKSRLELDCVGAGAVNQAVKAIAIARGFVASSGIDLICIPAFMELDIDYQEKTGIKLIVKEEK